MEKNNKVYGFTILTYEFMETIPTLWETTRNFMTKFPQFVNKKNLMSVVSDNGGESYNGCHCECAASPDILIT